MINKVQVHSFLFVFNQSLEELFQVEHHLKDAKPDETGGQDE